MQIDIWVVPRIFLRITCTNNKIYNIYIGTINQVVTIGLSSNMRGYVSRLKLSFTIVVNEHWPTLLFLTLFQQRYLKLMCAFKGVVSHSLTDVGFN